MVLQYCGMLKKLAPLFIQSEIKPKPVVTDSHTFSRALHRVFALCFDWSTGLPVLFVIGQSDNFGLVLRNSIKNRSNARKAL